MTHIAVLCHPVMAGIYIHIPFCARRCSYCAFFSTVRHAERQRYTDCICRELHMRGKDFTGSAKLFTVYFGGGTPSQLEMGQIRQILDAVLEMTGECPILEMTIECNPDDINADFATGLRDMGFNRISMGIQTFNDSLLRLLGRRHTSERAIQAVTDCRKAGFDNISIDLMYGLPGQTAAMQEHDLQTATGLAVTHISSYCLSYEEGSPLSLMKDRGQITPADDDSCADMYRRMCDHMGSHGFTHYEISNFALPGFESKHNSSYWNGTPYLGAGAGAHSFNGRSRLWNPDSLDSYMNGIEKGLDIIESENLSKDDIENESIMLGLRTAGGMDLEKFERNCGTASLARLKKEAAPFVGSGRLIINDGRMIIPECYMFISDDIISSLFC